MSEQPKSLTLKGNCEEQHLKTTAGWLYTCQSPVGWLWLDSLANKRSTVGWLSSGRSFLKIMHNRYFHVLTNCQLTVGCLLVICWYCVGDLSLKNMAWLVLVNAQWMCEMNTHHKKAPFQIISMFYKLEPSCLQSKTLRLWPAKFFSIPSRPLRIFSKLPRSSISTNSHLHIMESILHNSHKKLKLFSVEVPNILWQHVIISIPMSTHDPWQWDLTDFTLSHVTWFYSSTGAILRHLRCQWVNIKMCVILLDFKLRNKRCNNSFKSPDQVNHVRQ